MVRLCSLTVCLCAALLLSPAGVVEAQPEDRARSVRQAALAIEGFRLPDGIEGAVFAADPDVANPVAFAIDHRGRVYVCETFRQSKGVEDNRGHMDWLEDDLSLTDVEQRREMFEKYLGAKIVDYTLHEDRIRLLEDTDGDGRADVSTIFADGFDDVLDGTGAGVLPVGDDVWYTCIPHLWTLTDTDGDGKADEREALSSGYGIRVAFRGHDMHGLVRGPDGRIYFSIGDRGFNVTTDEGQHLFHPDTGAVLRCEPDGSNLEVYAYGLRNPQELAFDDAGNLFTVDNNSDGGDKARLVYVAQGGDTGWRMYYQYLPDRGPWNRERMWDPYRADDETTAVQPAYIIPPIVHLGDGPSGLTAYPGVGLPERYDGHFFLADFRGTAANSGIRSFAVEPDGASFQIADSHEYLWSILATDVDFGFDGKLYVSDWVDGWEGTGRGRIYAFWDSEKINDWEVLDTIEVARTDVAALTSKDLAEHLRSHPDRRIRQVAQFALVDRREVELLKAIVLQPDARGRLNALWGLGQLARVDRNVAELLPAFISDPDPEVRALAARLLGDVPQPIGVGSRLGLLRSGSPRESYFAAISLGQQGVSDALQPVMAMLKANDNADPLLRHAGVMALLGIAREHGLDVLPVRSTLTPPQRLAVVLVLRRLESPRLAEFLDDSELPIVVEAARAIHDLGIPEAMPALAALPMTSDLPDALARRVLNANFRLGGLEHAQRVAAFAADTGQPTHLRQEAGEMLVAWDEPSRLDRVTNEFRPLERVDRNVARTVVEPIVPALMAESGGLQKLAVKLASAYRIDASAEALRRLVESADAEAQVQQQALLALGSLKPPGLDEVIDKSLGAPAPELRMAARALLVERQPERAVAQLRTALDEGTWREQQHAVNLLANLEGPQATELLRVWLARLVAGDAPPAIQLDILQAARQKPERFAKELQQHEAQLPAGDKLAPYRVALEGGDVDRGREIFFGRADASCRRCHKVNGEGSDVGPDLSAIAKENPREYLLEAIVDPNAKIAKGFETVVYLTQDGRVHTGIVKGEDETTVRLMQPQGEIIVVAKDEIEEQAKGVSGMPADLTKSLSKSDIRDLVEYLSTLKTPAAAADGHR